MRLAQPSVAGEVDGAFGDFGTLLPILRGHGGGYVRGRRARGLRCLPAGNGAHLPLAAAGSTDDAVDSAAVALPADGCGVTLGRFAPRGNLVPGTDAGNDMRNPSDAVPLEIAHWRESQGLR
ncbi:hypothetical protein [Plastoroseomonas hellenica]|uniref:hypothetical protein n=1 Tax=Plastoroseomonas hellenica TaxID=2687306 RepID=UPI001BA83AF0|nr:hypothetical protein [Plastoroseomonas hellenica]MBR0641235.1 hypothetical protein [Plastoroseomonas hellenica]